MNIYYFSWTVTGLYAPHRNSLLPSSTEIGLGYMCPSAGLWNKFCQKYFSIFFVYRYTALKSYLKNIPNLNNTYHTIIIILYWKMWQKCNLEDLEFKLFLYGIWDIYLPVGPYMTTSITHQPINTITQNKPIRITQKGWA